MRLVGSRLGFLPPLVPQKPNSITLARSKLVRSWFELKFGLSSSLLAAKKHELAGSRPDSITLSGSKLVADSVTEFGFEPVCDQLRTSFEPASIMEFGFYRIFGDKRHRLDALPVTQPTVSEH